MTPATASAAVSDFVAGIRISHAARSIYPELEFSKRDLARLIAPAAREVE